MENIIELTDSDFDNAVIGSELPVLVDFWAEWCAPCKMIAPIIDELAKELQGKLKVYKIDVDENPETAAKFHITSIPTVLLFKDGLVKERLVGALSKSALLEKIKKWL